MIYLFWRVYFYTYFWLLFKIVWPMKKLVRLGEADNSPSRTVRQKRA